MLVQGGAGAVGQALILLGKQAGLENWTTARAEHRDLVRALGAIPIDYKREDFTKVLPEGFDAVFDGLGQGGYDRSFKHCGQEAFSVPTAIRRVCQQTGASSPF